MNTKRRHIFSDGTILYKRPSLITEVYNRARVTSRVYGDVVAQYRDSDGYAYKYYLDGQIVEDRFETEEQAKFERERLVKFAGGEVVPPELRLS